LERLVLEDGADRLSRNVGYLRTNIRYVRSPEERKISFTLRRKSETTPETKFFTQLRIETKQHVKKLSSEAMADSA
jgi:hypothetical protein